MKLAVLLFGLSFSIFAADYHVKLLSYNVAGLPQEISSENPLRNIPKISPLLNGYDIVMVQEDFAYHAALVRDLFDYIFRTRQIRTGPFGLGDGLSMFGNKAFFNIERHPWKVCSGWFNRASDCLTPKGFAFKRYKLSEGHYIAIINLHLDAGRAPEDQAAREQQLIQLIEFVKAKVEDLPLIMAGDWNLRRENPVDAKLLSMLENDLNVQSACQYFSCNDETIDKVYFRNGKTLGIMPLVRRFETARFQDQQGRSLSDHEPLYFEFLVQDR